MALRFPSEARDRLGEAGPDPQLAAWLRNGKPPVYFGLGSMPVRDPSETLGIIESVARETRRTCGCRRRLVAPEGRQNLPDHLRVVGAVDHGSLFPQCGAAVHHGGAGTVIAAAGLPSVACSVFADQPFWGVRLERLDVSVHLPFKKFGKASLEGALRRASASALKSAAAQLGAALRAEPDAVPWIGALIEQLGKPALRAA
ncbi:MAG TPA: nucleotide disphospho-sugar-binding domain-containing protein [Roseiarcus sp.]